MKTFFIRLSVAALIITVCFFHTNGQESNTKERKNKNNPLVGTWQLIDFANTDATGNWVYPFGRQPRGFVTYTRTGIFNINMSSEVPMPVTEEESKTRTITLDEFLWTYSFGYFGTYAVDFKKSIVTHQVKGGTMPWFVGTDQPRPFILEGDTLVIGDNKTWKRVLIKAD